MIRFRVDKEGVHPMNNYCQHSGENCRFRIEIPTCWRDLVQLDFDDLPTYPTSEKLCTGPDDPAPHYDDSRQIAVRCSCGKTAVAALMSGQSNYYGGLSIYDEEMIPLFESDPLESFGEGSDEFEGTDGKTYCVEWVLR